MSSCSYFLDLSLKGVGSNGSVAGGVFLSVVLVLVPIGVVPVYVVCFFLFILVLVSF